MTIFHKSIGDGFPIVFIHGWSLDHQVMLHAMEPLFEKRKGWKRIYIDLPGMGRSEAESSIKDSDGMLDAVLLLLDEIIPGEPFIVCGHSYGGYLARGIVRKRQELVRGLLLMAPMTVPAFDDRVLPKRTVLKKDNKLIAGLTKEGAEEFCSVGVVQCQAEWQRFNNEILLPSKQSNWDFLNHVQQNGYGFTFDISVELDLPALIIAGQQDHVVGFQDTWHLIDDYPRATFAVLDMAGHNLQIEQPDLFNALVENWLSRLEEEVLVIKGAR